VVETISAALGLRGANLEAALKKYFHGEIEKGKTFTEAIYAHPLVQTLSKQRSGRLPSYIPKEVLSQVVESLVVAREAGGTLRDAVEKLPGSPQQNRIKAILQIFAEEAQGDLARFRTSVEAHFDRVMDRASGWFKRYTQYLALGVAAVLVFGSNLDTLAIARSLSVNPEARVQLVTTASALVENSRQLPPPPSGEVAGTQTGSPATMESEEARRAIGIALKNLENTGVPIGWQEFPDSFMEGLSKLCGLLVSIFAVSLGAPFWFDVLQRVVRIRGSGGIPAR
jgi:hypothetical protein